MKWILLMVVVFFDPVKDAELRQAVVLEVLDSEEACLELREYVVTGMELAYQSDDSYKISCVHQDEFDAHLNEKEVQHELGQSRPRAV